MKKNICFFFGDISKVGGIERVGTTLANEISKLEDKYNVYILSISKINKEIFFKINDNIKIHYFYDRPARYKKDYYYIVKKVREFLKQESIDIIIDVDIMLDMFTLPAKFMLSTKLISWEHFNFGENVGTNIMGLSRELAAKFSDYIIVLTEEDKLEFQRNLNLNCPIECIYNPIKISVSNESYKNDSKTILSVGRLTSQKGFDMLIDVAKSVFEQHPNWNWTILGEGEDRELLQNKIHEYNLADKIELVGNVSNVDEYYRSSSIFVLTSRYEGLGLVLLEAKSNKLPIVSFDCKFGPSEIIEDSENGYLVECFNINYMSEKICTLIENESLRLKFSEESYRKMDKFNPNSIVKKWEEVFDLLV